MSDPFMDARRIDGKCAACGRDIGEGCGREDEGQNLGCFLLGGPPPAPLTGDDLPTMGRNSPGVPQSIARSSAQQHLQGTDELVSAFPSVPLRIALAASRFLTAPSENHADAARRLKDAPLTDKDLRDAILKGFEMAGGEGGIGAWLDKLAKDHPGLAKQARILKVRLASMGKVNG